MASNDHSRSGAQTAADLARLAKAVYNMIKAALAAGLKGAAAAAVKETLPLLVKVASGILVAILLIPMLIFTALPNMFFGYGSSGTDVIANMTQQALTVGGAYMSLEDFEKSQIDSVVTSIVADYEEEGTAIDRIEVESSFDEEDLIWFIAINSVAHQQDLDAMSAEDIRSFSVSRLSYWTDEKDPVLLRFSVDGRLISLFAVLHADSFLGADVRAPPHVRPYRAARHPVIRRSQSPGSAGHQHTVLRPAAKRRYPPLFFVGKYLNEQGGIRLCRRRK